MSFEQSFVENQHGILNWPLSKQKLDSDKLCHYAENVTVPWNNSLKRIQKYFHTTKTLKEASKSQNKNLAENNFL